MKCCSFNKCNPQTLFYFRFQRYNPFGPSIKIPLSSVHVSR
jgi:hypothetical protein